MMKRAMAPFMMAVSLGGASALGACTTTNSLDLNTCSRVNSSMPKITLPSIIQSLLPSYNHTRPNMPCMDSKFFMALVDIARMPENAHNHHIQGMVLEYYNEMKGRSGRDRYANETVSMIDRQLTAIDLPMERIAAAYEANKPAILSSNQDGQCWQVVVREYGQLMDERVCMSGWVPTNAP